MPQREWSRREPRDIDGKAVRPNERARVSQYHDENLYSQNCRATDPVADRKLASCFGDNLAADHGDWAARGQNFGLEDFHDVLGEDSDIAIEPSSSVSNQYHPWPIAVRCRSKAVAPHFGPTTAQAECRMPALRIHSHH